MARRFTIFLILAALTVEVLSSSSSFVRAHVGDHSKVIQFLSAHPDQGGPEFSPKVNLKQRRFLFQVDGAVAVHASAAEAFDVLSDPVPDSAFGFHRIDRPLKDVPFSIFQPPRAV